MAASNGIGSFRRAFERFWVEGVLMWCLEHCPRIARALQPLCVGGAWMLSARLRDHTTGNAHLVLGPGASRRSQHRLARAFVNGAFNFLMDFGRHRNATLEDLRCQIGAVDGIENYERARALRRGLIVVTAHLGAFEVGMAALRGLEEKVHVVFQRDPMPAFERLRAARRAALRVLEAPIDDGLRTWLRVRDALRNDEVVCVQGDRVMPGQRSVRVPFFNALLPLPTGPVRLAKLTGAPLLPVFSVYEPDRRVRIIVEEPVMVDEGPISEAEVMEVTANLARVIERRVREYPEQYHAVHAEWRQSVEGRRWAP